MNHTIKPAKHFFITIITLSRIPVAGIFYYILQNNRFSLFPLLFVCIAYIELSDILDGFLARKLQVVSNLGKILDPAADVTSHFLCILAFNNKSMIPQIVILIFVLREYWILLLRSQLIQKGIVLAADILGKIKTVLYALAIIAILLFFPNTRLAPYLLFYKSTLNILWYLASAASIISALHYSIRATIKLRAIKNINRPSTNVPTNVQVDTHTTI